MIKAQVLAGGRGKGKFDSGLQGGVHLVTGFVVLRSDLKPILRTPSAQNKQEILQKRCLETVSLRSRPGPKVVFATL